MIKSKQLRLERQAYLTRRRQLEAKAEFNKMRDRLSLLANMKALEQEVIAEIQQNIL
jgi:hypothetical protein